MRSLWLPRSIKTILQSTFSQDVVPKWETPLPCYKQERDSQVQRKNIKLFVVKNAHFQNKALIYLGMLFFHVNGGFKTKLLRVKTLWPWLLWGIASTTVGLRVLLTLLYILFNSYYFYLTFESSCTMIWCVFSWKRCKFETHQWKHLE